ANNGLPAVRELVVLPSPVMDGVPADVVAEDYTVSYAPSGSLFAYLRQLKPPAAQGLLVLADPVFEKPKAETVEKKLPPGGVLLDVVAPESPASRAGLRAGDVLLRYADTELKTPDDLTRALQAHGQDKDEVKLSVWRDGETMAKLAPPGKLGIILA